MIKIISTVFLISYFPFEHSFRANIYRLTKSQDAIIEYETGSDWLAVKACITEMHCNMELDREATLKKMKEDQAA